MLALVVAALAVSADAWTDQYCVQCHGAQRKAAGLSLVGFAPSDGETSEKVIRKLRAGMMPPPGSPRPEALALREWVQDLEKRVDAAAKPSPGWRPFQRLNAAEYERAVSDLLGFDADVTAFAPPDSFSQGFDNIADSQLFSPTLITGYLRGASILSRKALASPAGRKKILTCTPAQDKACVTSILKALTAQAYRGAATERDHADIRRFYEQGNKSGGFENGIRLALQAILASPRFLFRLEAVPEGGGAAFRLNDSALASRLSFFLWGSGPDMALLRKPRDIERQTRRMLADGRSSALSTRFASQWLGLQDVLKAEPDRLLFPRWSGAVARSMIRETELFFDTIVREDRSVLDLLSADYSMLDERLAQYYGIEGVSGTAFRRVKMPPERQGLLGHGSMLVATSVTDRSSPVLRGKWVLEVLLGTPPPPPPPNVPALEDSVKPIRAGRKLSTRQRIELHRSNPSCAGCHKIIDPLGMALENFDASGSWRTLDNDVPVDAAGELYDGTKMQGPVGLRQALLQRQDLFLLSFTEHLFTYALGRRLEHTDMPAVRLVIRQAAAHDNRFSAFVLGIVQSDAFQMSELKNQARK